MGLKSRRWYDLEYTYRSASKPKSELSWPAFKRRSGSLKASEAKDFCVKSAFSWSDSDHVCSNSASEVGNRYSDPQAVHVPVSDPEYLTEHSLARAEAVLVSTQAIPDLVIRPAEPNRLR